MSLSHENKNIYIRRALYALLLLLAAVLQNTQGLFPEIFGVRAMLLIPAVVCIGMHERDIAGLFFGLSAGRLIRHNSKWHPLTLLNSFPLNYFRDKVLLS